MDDEFVKKLIGYLSLEENKGKDKFHSKYFVFFKVKHISIYVQISRDEKFKLIIWNLSDI